MDANRPVVIYISAAKDLMPEREALARMIAELPVTLAWRVIQTPLGPEKLDLDALAEADFYLLLMGGDIRAPVGVEWHAAHRTGQPIIAFLKEKVLRTPAAQIFIRDTAAWRSFKDAAGLSGQVQRVLAEQLVQRAVEFALSPAEVERLIALRSDESGREQALDGEGAGRSAVILSRERFTPSEGVVVDNE